MSNTKSETESTGVRLVEQYVREHWKCRFQEFSAANDDGLDGMIFLAKNGEVTGEVIYVQIKTGHSYLREVAKRPSKIHISLSKKYIDDRKKRWEKYPGAVILIWVDSSTNKNMPKAWWTDLNSESSYAPEAGSYVLIDKKNRFGSHTKGELKKLCLHQMDRQTEQIKTAPSDFQYLNSKLSAKICAQQKFRTLAAAGVQERTHGGLGEIIISRVFWNHINRYRRNKIRINQSYQLLGCILPIISNTCHYQNVGSRESFTIGNEQTTMNYAAVRAKVTFDHRYQAMATMIFKRKKIIDTANGNVIMSKVWLYTIYENRRGISMK